MEVLAAHVVMVATEHHRRRQPPRRDSRVEGRRERGTSFAIRVQDPRLRTHDELVGERVHDPPEIVRILLRRLRTFALRHELLEGLRRDLVPVLNEYWMSTG